MSTAKPDYDQQGLIIPYKRWPTLYGKRADGGIDQWTISVAMREDGATILVEFGKMGGKQQQQEELIRCGKNTGKKNATTPYEQAVKEAHAKWVKKNDRDAYRQAIDALDQVELRPMLAEVYWDKINKVNWARAHAQPKLDGYRCLATKQNGIVLLYSRKHTLFDINHICEQLDPILPEGFCLDGEIWTPELTFQQIGSAIKRQQENTDKLRYMVYDAVLPTEFPTRYEAARAVVESATSEGGALELVETVPVSNEKQLLKLHDRWVKDLRLEGAMLRHGEEGYRMHTRSVSLLKVKQHFDAEFTVVDVREGTGTHAGLAVLCCAMHNGVTFNVESPGSHADQAEVFQNRDRYVGKRLTVEYKGFTTSAVPVPREPVARGWKD